MVAYAAHLTGDTGMPWGPVLDRIAHKHASLGITATQYPIVGRHLLAAVGEVLGDAVTPEVAAAWDEVYWLLACELIAREARLYAGAGVPEGGPVWRDWRVTGRARESADVVSLTLAPADGGAAPGFTPGRYVSVAVDLDGGRGQQIRQYSLSGRPGARRVADHREAGTRRGRRARRDGLRSPARAGRGRRHAAAEPGVRRG